MGDEMALDRTFEYWRNRQTGEYYAVENVAAFSDDGLCCDAVVKGAAGPLHHSEVTRQNLLDENFNLDAETAEWIKQHIDSFDLVTDQESIREEINEAARHGRSIDLSR
jgi:hypothetical protein